MRPFQYDRAADPAAAMKTASDVQSANFLAGGTTLLDLMKLDVMRPTRVIDITALQAPLRGIEIGPQGLRLGALTKMSEAADHPEIKKNYPVLAQSLSLAASAQIRNMATLGGNVLQRTRCVYFRDVSYGNCNKRIPGSGCAALEGMNRKHAVLGTSEACIATYPGDFAQALIALDAQVDLVSAQGARSMAFAELHRAPGNTPDIETTLRPGEMIVAFRIDGKAWPRSMYLKIRDRQSYEFALSSVAVALDVADGKINEARIALGGVATVPWRARDAEAELKGKAADEAVIAAVAEKAFGGAKGREHNAFKIDLGKRAVTRAIRETLAMEA